MIGYGFAGVFRDILVRPPKIYYPGVLPNVSLFNAMHRNPTVTRNSLKYFIIVAVAAFIWEWFPELIFPVLASLPIICWFGHGNPIAYVLGSGTYGFGFLTLSLDWNYINSSVLEYPWYTPLWAYMTMCAGVIFSAWFLYPILYYTNTLGAQTWPAMASGTYDANGTEYNITRVMTADYRLNQTAMDEYSRPYWSLPYVFSFFFAFACSTGAITYAILWYGKSVWKAAKDAFKNRTELDDYNDPYLKLMSFDPRVPHWWYLALLGVCAALSLGTIYGAGLQLPWWGFIIMALVSWAFTLPNGILWGVANQQIGMAYLSEVIAGSLFHGSPTAVLMSMTYARQILEQNLNLISDYKFGFYMKIPEKEMFIGQVWGTLLGPFINVCLMQYVIDDIGIPKLTGEVPTVNWYAAKTKNFYSLSVLWGVLGPQTFFGKDSPYNWAYYGFVIGPAAMIIVWLMQKTKLARNWNLEHYCNPTLFFLGAAMYPIYPMTNFFTAFLASVITMGYVYRYHPAWWRKYHYLTGVGMDCGTQLMQTVLAFCISLPNLNFPTWWGNQPTYIDRCFPPNSKLPPAMQLFPDSS
ncbi:Oligopeptide transporter 7 [Pseudocercospora fuligena]|uniref:Oligopeptide transporter 7 n=1 Tax=Pseudocercospora fuligena TaxID=685502 RepID=A0A8H6VK76_9PEZI|nr:Oligopeptide transporter 7 [Pseudocercospora fuligena]